MVENEAEGEGRYRAPALDKGLDMIELLAAQEEGMTLKDISLALGRSPTELYRMLDRLARRGYVARRGDTYELTMKLFLLAHLRPPIRRLVGQAMPIMRRFTGAAEQACHLVKYDRGNLVVIAQVEAPGYWGVTIRVGARVGMVGTGSGHVLLAQASDEERRLMFEEHEWMPYEPRAPKDLEARLAQVRASGYESMESQQTAGVYNLSVPILGGNGTVLAALTCPFVRRLENPDAPDLDSVLALLLDAGRELSGIPAGA
ncbi:IclR family transcriptional regulator [Paracoccus sp. CPCC 101403]|uniref:IclR family transcriptional regulator n=2 Tax=Paracoccus broussonetiae TaxID=3075834 RepID=A0ABU3E9U2_9RHOB|nr:IclR family transcriptional regulator [Paracoccus sp. CPCC 101403]MDT1060988.1 IclR family transcriptional regulator [Paracoccus sp. CPCC 101403]